MTCVKLTIATTDYDHFRDFRLGAVRAEGIDHTWLMLGHHEMFARFTFNREWEVSELSFAKSSRPSHASQLRYHRASRRLLAPLPFLFVLRQHRRAKSKPLRRLQGQNNWIARNGLTPPRSICAGGLTTSMASGLRTFIGIQAGANEAGQIEKVELNLPSGLKLTRIAERSLSDMLANGDIDCALIARPPDCFRQGHPDVVRLFPDYWEMEEAYYKRPKSGRSCISS